jgi:hypothetical protein
MSRLPVRYEVSAPVCVARFKSVEFVKTFDSLQASVFQLFKAIRIYVELRLTPVCM